uniref:Uncharacterized protein n=1 Tax=Siphoviridae sp. ctXZx16 TaxID=2826371 RepID=A0A8S5MKY3_9CAUD|nr:MAG TPA: hypothetical protein [Siphoviridae sp. ctXZx16]
MPVWGIPYIIHKFWRIYKRNVILLGKKENIL